MHAIENGQIELAKRLIESDADIHSQDHVNK
jgi:hypothetical protein